MAYCLSSRCVTSSCVRVTISDSYGAEIALKVAKAGGLKVAVDAIRRFPDDDRVQQAACSAAINIACDRGTRGAVCAVLMKIFKRVLMFEWLCVVTAGRIALTKAGGLVMALAAMRRHADIVEVVLSACGVIASVMHVTHETGTLCFLFFGRTVSDREIRQISMCQLFGWAVLRW